MPFGQISTVTQQNPVKSLNAGVIPVLNLCYQEYYYVSFSLFLQLDGWEIYMHMVLFVFKWFWIFTQDVFPPLDEITTWFVYWQRYLDEAEREKMQYAQELKEYQQTEAYQITTAKIQDKRIKKGDNSFLLTLMWLPLIAVISLDKWQDTTFLFQSYPSELYWPNIFLFQKILHL